MTWTERLAAAYWAVLMIGSMVYRRDLLRRRHPKPLRPVDLDPRPWLP